MRALLALAFVVGGLLLVPSVAAAEPPPPPSLWRVGVAFGAEGWLSGELGQHGFGLVDVRRERTARGTLRFLYNTDTLQLGLENIRLLDGTLELSVVARGEALLAGLLFDYYERGERIASRSFYASYVQLLPALKWHAADRHSLELVMGVRQWFFGRGPSTASDFTLPPDTFVFEPRLSYTYWRIRSPGSEWEPHRLHPRITGVAFGVQLGLDRRHDRRAWGASIAGELDPRNAPDDVILMARQWLYAGVPLSPIARLQFEEHASYGAGEDDLTRNRLGGMNPYVVPVSGLPWAAVLSERLVSLRAGLHLRPRRTSPHELGLGVDAAAFSDARRSGDLDAYSGAGGAFAFGDFRLHRWQLHGRFGYAFPTRWLLTGPNVSLLLTAGVRIR